MKKYCSLIALVILLYGYTYAGTYPDKNHFLNSNGSDTIPAVKTKDLKAAEKDAEKLKSGILKKIGKALSFKKNIRARQRTFILQTIAELDFNDTIVASSQRLKRLIDTIAVKQDVRFESLTKLMDSLLVEVGKRREVIIKPAVDSAAIVEVKNEAETGMEIVPVSTPAFIKKEADNDKEKREKLNLMRQIIAAGNERVVSRNDADGNLSTYKYTLDKKTEICGYYNANSPYTYTYSSSVNLLSTLMYDSLLEVTKTGILSRFIEWQNDQLLNAAKKNGCRIIYSILPSSLADVSIMIRNAGARLNFINQVHALHDNNMADGININFSQMPVNDEIAFFQFMAEISRQLKKDLPGFRIYLTLPPFDQQRFYSVKMLDPLVDRFCIDFSVISSKQALPLAALKGKQTNTLSTSISYYLKQEVAPAKFIVNLGYRGVKWIIDEKKTSSDKFQQYLSYATIRSKPNSEVLYDEESTTAYIDTAYTATLKSRIWFDDENTFAPKYDFILESGLGGIGFSYLGYDGRFGELLDLLVYKFIKVDTAVSTEHRTTDLSFFQKLRRRLVLYQYVIQNPCAACFEREAGSPQWDSVRVYVSDLKIDSVIQAHNRKFLRFKAENRETDKTPKTPFLYVTKELNDVFFYASLFFLVTIVIATGVYITAIRSQGDYWKNKKKFTWILLGLSILFLWSLFNYFFTNDLVPFFGVSTDDGSSNIRYVKEMDGRINCLPVEDCTNISLQTLEGIIVIAALIGVVLARYLILPLLKKEDIP